MMKSNPQHHPSSGITRPQPRRSLGRESDCFRRRNSFHPTGFTLIEMLVAFSIMVVMVVIIDRVFVQAGNAIRAGIGTSEITSNYRSLADQIDRDANAMIAPGSGGILVVIHHVLGDWDDNGILDGDANNDGMIGPGETAVQTSPGHHDGVEIWHSQWGSIRRLVRSDQLVFMADSSKWNALTPGSNTDFGNVASANYAKVWYGHAMMTQPDGSIPAGWRLGGSNINGNLNALGHRLVLGRQALLLAGIDISSPPSGLSIYAHDSNRLSYLMNTQGIAGTPPLAHGYTDVCSWSLAGPDRGASWPHQRLTGGGLGWLESNSGAVANDISLVNYQRRAFDMTYGNARLRANTRPDYASATPAQQLQRIAQMHPVFAANVSDFIVDFALDMDNNGEIDTGPGFPAGVDSKLRAYPAIAAGYIAWYTSPSYVNYPGSPNGYDSNKPLLFNANLGLPPTHSGWTAPLANPYVASPEDNNGSLAFAGTGYVWRHDDPSNWPYLLRIRYRLHDKDSRLGGGVEGVVEPGKWFEQIVKVNRP